MKGKRAKSQTEGYTDLILESPTSNKDPTPNFGKGDRVWVKFANNKPHGRVKGISPTMLVIIRVDPEEGETEGEVIKVEPTLVRYEKCKNHAKCGNRSNNRDRLCPACRIDAEHAAEQAAKAKAIEAKKGQNEQAAFTSDGVRWRNNHTTFHFETSEGVTFYGWYRRTRQRNSETIAHCIDIYAKHTDAEGKMRDVAVDSIVYLNHDPRENLKAANADLCALANRWFFQRLNGKAETLDTLMSKAEKPTIRINRLETVDRLLMKLREYRDTGMRCGGERILEIKGDDDTPPVTLFLNLSAQSFALKGKVPALDRGALYDVTLDKKGEGKGTRRVVNTPSAGNVDALVKALQAAKEQGNKSEARKIRAILRNMGHKGGSRGMDKDKAAANTANKE